MKAYPKYTASDVDWIGAIPSHWGLDRIKASIFTTKMGVWGSEPEAGTDDIPCVRVADFDRVRNVINSPVPTLRAVSPSERNGRILSKGDLLLERSGGGERQPVGCVVLYALNEEAVCSNFVSKLRLKDNMSPSYWRYFHHAAYHAGVNCKSIKQVTGIQNLDQGAYLDECASYPPRDEQIAIAAFLDHESGKIDNLIAEQERLIALLGEKRQAVISHAVTKGLDPHVEMKDSGIDWLGEVPSHWECKPYKHLVDIQNGRDHKDVETDQGYPVIGSGGPFTFASEILHNGEAVLLGRKGTVDKPLYINGPFWAVDTMYWAKIRPNSHGRFTYYAALTIPFSYYSTNTALPSMTKTDLGRHPTATPPLSEQSYIAASLDHQIGKIDSLLLEQRHLIVLLRERRSALISAAVTGKIDVRNHPAAVAALNENKD